MTRFPDKETAPGWTQGVPLEKAKVLVSRWGNGYDWRRYLPPADLGVPIVTVDGGLPPADLLAATLAGLAER